MLQHSKCALLFPLSVNSVTSFQYEAMEMEMKL